MKVLRQRGGESEMALAARVLRQALLHGVDLAEICRRIKNNPQLARNAEVQLIGASIIARGA